VPLFAEHIPETNGERLVSEALFFQPVAINTLGDALLVAANLSYPGEIAFHISRENRHSHLTECF
jgi:hypothetical protein